MQKVPTGNNREHKSATINPEKTNYKDTLSLFAAKNQTSNNQKLSLNNHPNKQKKMSFFRKQQNKRNKKTFDQPRKKIIMSPFALRDSNTFITQNSPNLCTEKLNQNMQNSHMPKMKKENYEKIQNKKEIQRNSMLFQMIKRESKTLEGLQQIIGNLNQSILQKNRSQNLQNEARIDPVQIEEEPILANFQSKKERTSDPKKRMIKRVLSNTFINPKKSQFHELSNPKKQQNSSLEKKLLDSSKSPSHPIKESISNKFGEIKLANNHLKKRIRSHSIFPASKKKMSLDLRLKRKTIVNPKDKRGCLTNQKVFQFLNISQFSGLFNESILSLQNSCESESFCEESFENEENLLDSNSESNLCEISEFQTKNCFKMNKINPEFFNRKNFNEIDFKRNYNNRIENSEFNQNMKRKSKGNQFNQIHEMVKSYKQNRKEIEKLKEMITRVLEQNESKLANEKLQKETNLSLEKSKEEIKKLKQIIEQNAQKEKENSSIKKQMKTEIDKLRKENNRLYKENRHLKEMNGIYKEMSVINKSNGEFKNTLSNIKSLKCVYKSELHRKQVITSVDRVKNERKKSVKTSWERMIEEKRKNIEKVQNKRKNLLNLDLDKNRTLSQIMIGPNSKNGGTIGNQNIQNPTYNIYKGKVNVKLI